MQNFEIVPLIKTTQV